MSRLELQLGQPIAAFGSGYPSDTSLPALTEIVTMNHECFSISGLIQQTSTLATVSSVAANKPSAFPFVLDEAITVYQLGWINGSAAGGNADIGIYDSVAGVPTNRLVSAGSTACAGNSVWQFVDVTDTVIPAGGYFLAYCRDDAVAGRIIVHDAAWGQPLMALAGVMDSGTAQFPLPNPLASMIVAAVATYAPALAIAIRALV